MMVKIWLSMLQRLHNQLGHLSARLRDPRRELLEKAQRMDELELRLNKAIRDRLDQQKQKTDYLIQRMSAQSPRRTLKTVKEQTQRLEERLTLAPRHQLRQWAERGSPAWNVKAT